MAPTAYYLALSGLLFAIGMIGVLTRRTAIMIFLSVELMLNAANLALVAFGTAVAGFFIVVTRTDPSVRQDAPPLWFETAVCALLAALTPTLRRRARCACGARATRNGWCRCCRSCARRWRLGCACIRTGGRTRRCSSARGGGA